MASPREYTAPSVKTLRAQQVVELMGPAQANVSGGGGGGSASSPIGPVMGAKGGGSSFGH